VWPASLCNGDCLFDSILGLYRKTARVQSNCIAFQIYTIYCANLSVSFVF
jgi:hypothetical protein